MDTLSFLMKSRVCIESKKCVYFLIHLNLLCLPVCKDFESFFGNMILNLNGLIM